MRSSFSSRLAAACAAVSLLALPACVKAKSAATLNKDGSGTVNDSVVMDLGKMEEIVEMIKGMMGGGETGGEGPSLENELDDKTDPEKIKERLKGKKGVEIVSVARVDDPEKKTRTMDLKVKFASLEDYFRSGADSLFALDVKLEKLADGSWRFTRLMLRDGDDPTTGEMSDEAAGMLEAAKPMFGDVGEFDISATYALPGTIVETNGTKSADGTSVTWSFSLEKLFSKEALRQTVTFKGEGLALKPFHLKVDDKGNATDAAAPAETAVPAETR